MKFNLLALLFIFLLCACASSPPKKPDMYRQGDYSYLKAYLSWLIEKEMSAQDVVGLSIAVVDDQQVVWAQGFGYADKVNKIPATPKTLYRVGSISKLFTDSLVMQFAEQEKLDIDKPLQTYLPEFSINTRFLDAGAITPRNVMTHHSGLPGDINNGMWTRHPKPFKQLVGQLKDEYAAYPPNTIWSYSNLGIALLGAMIEHVAAKDFNTYAEQHLLQPLGMNAASFDQNLAKIGVAKAYKENDEKTEVPLRDTAAGGLNANVLDMSRFMNMMFADGLANGKQILKPETLKEMLRQQNENVALDFGFKVGLGWWLQDDPSIGRIAGHGGATLYHQSQMSLLPEHKLGVIVSANSPSDLPTKIANKALKLATAIKTGKNIPIDEVKPEVDYRLLTAEELQKAAGQYATQYGYVKVVADDGELTAELDGNTVEFLARNDGSLTVRYKLFGVIPIAIDEMADVSLSLPTVDDHAALVANWQGQNFLVGEKITPTAIPPAWRERLGDYEIINLAGGDGFVPKNCSIQERDGFLTLQYSLPEFDANNLSMPIAVLSDNEALILGLGAGKRETLRFTQFDGEEMLAYSGYLLRKKQKGLSNVPSN